MSQPCHVCNDLTTDPYCLCDKCKEEGYCLTFTDIEKGNKTMTDQDFAFFLEKRLLPPDKLYPDDIPIQAMDLYHQGKDEGVPRYCLLSR